MQLLKRSLYYIARRIGARYIFSNLSLIKLPVRNVAITASLFDFNQWGTKKANRKLKIALVLDMMDPKAEEALTKLRADVKEQVSAIWMQSRN